MNQNIQQMIHKIRTQQKPSKDDLVHLLGCEPSSATALFAAADSARRRYVGDEIHLRALLSSPTIAAAVAAIADCAKKIPTLNVTAWAAKKSMRQLWLPAAMAAKPLSSVGEDSYYDADTIARAVKMLKKLGLAVTLSCGNVPKGI